jgi:formylglycine-generating enzyme required for sulfatase activity
LGSPQPHSGWSFYLGEHSGRGRLPTEAEWEYAARAGTETRYWWSDSDSEIHIFANLTDASAKEKYPGWGMDVVGADGYADQAPVKKFPANPWGLYDMNGNVWEWVEDAYIADAYSQYAGHDTPENPVERPGAVVENVESQDKGAF